MKTNDLDSTSNCLNDLATKGLVSNESVVHLSTLLKKTQYHFGIFEKALQAEKDLEQPDRALSCLSMKRSRKKKVWLKSIAKLLSFKHVRLKLSLNWETTMKFTSLG
ncbi:hypothetical protein ACFX13_013332 [Malus domestica]